MPAYATGVGEGLLAAAPQALLKEVLDHDLVKVGPRIITNSSDCAAS